VGSNRFAVRYRFRNGKQACDGSAVVTTVNRHGRDFIQAIRAERGAEGSAGPKASLVREVGIRQRVFCLQIVARERPNDSSGRIQPLNLDGSIGVGGEAL
jgi:hypothetical protein